MVWCPWGISNEATHIVLFSHSRKLSHSRDGIVFFPWKYILQGRKQDRRFDFPDSIGSNQGSCPAECHDTTQHSLNLHHTATTTGTTCPYIATTTTLLHTIRHQTTLHYTTLQYTTDTTVDLAELQLQLQRPLPVHSTSYSILQLHYYTATTNQLRHNYNHNCNCTTPHYIQQLRVS